MPVIEGGLGIVTNPGAPAAGTDEVQTIATTGTPTGGTFRLSFMGFVTAAIAYNAAAATVQAALRALPPLSNAGVTCGGGPLPTGVTATFDGADTRARPQPAIALHLNALTGGTTPTVTVAETTPGVAETGIGSPKGALLTDTTNGKLYINTGTAGNPVWTVVGTQT
jgi:hypothetical protein